MEMRVIRSIERGFKVELRIVLLIRVSSVRASIFFCVVVNMDVA